MAMAQIFRGIGRPDERERGFILIAVLILTALLISLLAAVLETTSSYMFSTAAYVDAARENELGRSAGVLVIQKVLSSDPNARRGGAFSVHLPDATVSIDYQAESARADVNTTQPGLLVALFKAAGIEAGEADAIGERIRVWADSAKPSQDQDSDTTSADPGKSAPQADERPRLEHVSQLVDAWGISEENLAKVMPYLTVSNPSGKIDPIIADPLILSAMFGGDMDASAFLKHRADGFENESDALMAIPLGARGYVGFSAATAFHAIVRVELLNRIARRYEMTVVPPQKSGQSVQITAWKAL